MDEREQQSRLHAVSAVCTMSAESSHQCDVKAGTSSASAGMLKSKKAGRRKINRSQSVTKVDALPGPLDMTALS